MNACLQCKPEVGEAVGELALAGHICISKLPAADYQRLRMNVVSTQQNRDIFGIMLSVTIDGQGEIIAQFDGFSETRNECCPLASVLRMADDSNGKIEPVEYSECVVGAAIHHDDDVA